MNICHFAGNLTRDIEFNNTANGTKVANFGLAVNNGKNQTLFLNCTAFNSTAEFVQKYFTKGKFIIIHGSLKEESWDDKATGEKRKAIKVIVNNVDFAGNNKTESPGADSSSTGKKPTSVAPKRETPKSQRPAPVVNQPSFEDEEFESDDDGSVPF